MAHYREALRRRYLPLLVQEVLLLLSRSRIFFGYAMSLANGPDCDVGQRLANLDTAPTRMASFCIATSNEAGLCLLTYLQRYD